jgi:hypothetical protein
MATSLIARPAFSRAFAKNVLGNVGVRAGAGAGRGESTPSSLSEAGSDGLLAIVVVKRNQSTHDTVKYVPGGRECSPILVRWYGA